MRAVQALLLGLSALVLSACFESKQALINEDQSVTPVRAGTYVSLDTNDDFKVTLSGTVTSVAEVGGDGKTEVRTYLMRPLKPGYFVVMDRSNFDYGLINVDHQQVTSYSSYAGSEHCEQLEELAFAKDVPLSRFGVSALDRNRCYFDKFEKLAGAFGSLLDAGKLEVALTYRPKGQKVAQLSATSKQDNAPSALVDAQREMSRRGLTLDNLLDFIRASKDQVANRASTGAAAPADAVHQ